jgi:hypothetical protein
MINEQRDYFRINDKALLHLAPVDKQAAISNLIPAQFSEAPGYMLMNELNAIEKDGLALLHAIAEQNRDIEAYLKLINKKIDCLANHVIAQQQRSDTDKPIDITISEGGLSFNCNTAYTVDSYAAIQITFQPSQKSVIVFAKIISCTAISDAKYSIAVNYVNLKEPIRQQIAKHVLQFQLLQKRQAQKTQA